MKYLYFVFSLIWASISFGQLTNNQLTFLKRIVEINSATDNTDGLSAVRQILTNEFENLNFQVNSIDVHPDRNSHKVLHIRYPNSDNTITLLGHIDTVFTKSSNFNSLSINGKYLRGPGVIDMKAGILLIREIVKSLTPDELNHIQIILNDDEEIGSIFSKTVIRELIPPFSSVLIFEPGLPDGSIVTSQSGVAWFEINTVGKAAHAGLEPQNGFNACTEMAYKAIKIADLSNLNQGINLNPGVIMGGSKPNVVCDHSSLEVDVRFKTAQQYQILHNELQTITDKTYSPFIPANFSPSASIKRLAFLPPLTEEKTGSLFSIISALTDKIGFKVNGAHVGYGSDGNNISELPINILVVLGPYGGGMHTIDEFMDMESFNKRLILNSALIKKIINQNEK